MRVRVRDVREVAAEQDAIGEIAQPGQLVARERVRNPLLRDERPELNVRELQRIVAERSGLAADSVVR